MILNKEVITLGVGKGIKNLRKKNNLTMEDLAKELNNRNPDTLKLTKGKISKWENEKEDPRLSTAKIIAAFFGVTINDLFADDENEVQTSNTHAEINEILSKLTPERQNNVLDFVKYQYTTQQNNEDLP